LSKTWNADLQWLTDFITATIPLDELVEKGFNELIHNNENRKHSFVDIFRPHTELDR